MCIFSWLPFQILSAYLHLYNIGSVVKPLINWMPCVSISGAQAQVHLGEYSLYLPEISSSCLQWQIFAMVTQETIASSHQCSATSTISV